MLEDFLACKLMDQDKETFVPSNIDIFGALISVLIAIAAAYVAYQCNMKESMAMRLFATLLAFLFSGLYIIYYFFRYIIFKDKCY